MKITKKFIATGAAFLCFAIFMVIRMVMAPFSSHKQHLELTGNPTTGYTWVASVTDSGIINVDQDVRYMGKGGEVGAPSVFMYTISSIKPGTTQLKFEYKRPWEKSAPEDVVVYDVTVNDKGKLRIKDSIAEEF